MKVLVLNYEYPPVGGGGGRICAAVCERLAARGHEVRVVTAGLRGLPRREECGGVLVLRPQTYRRLPDRCTVAEMAQYIALAAPEALRQARGWKPGVIHAHFVVPTGVLALVVHTLTRIPCVVTAHLGDVPGGVPEQTARLFQLAKPVARQVWRRAAARTAVSTAVAALAKHAFGQDAEVIPNGIEPVPAPDLTPRAEPHILTVGRLSVQKNPVLAVRALALVADLRWRMTFLGDGPLEADARRATGEAGLADRIRFAGWQDASAVRAAMREADILLLPSLHEGLPMTAVEALWHGLAIVAGDIPGTAEVVEHNGARVPLTPEAMAAALRTLLTHPATLAAARQASRQLAARFDIEPCTEAYERILDTASQSP